MDNLLVPDKIIKLRDTTYTYTPGVVVQSQLQPLRERGGHAVHRGYRRRHLLFLNRFRIG